MSFRSYLTSRVFFLQILASIIILAAFSFLFINWLTFATNHGNEIMVPDLSNLSVEQAEEKLDAVNLDYVVIDTVDYKPRYPKLAIVTQEPTAGAMVKKGRRVYLKINASKYGLVTLPDLIEKTYRQVIPTLKSMGLYEGKITYIPYLAKDIVLELRLKGRKLKPGDKVFKSSSIDIVLGDGEFSYDESVDSTAIDSTEIIPLDEP
jgi:beta-lactam-binding protein with PASTA domain